MTSSITVLKSVVALSVSTTRNYSREPLRQSVWIEKPLKKNSASYWKLLSLAPPHGGIALGLDRMVMLLCGCKSIRDVIAFPKTQSGACPMTGAPSAASKEQLDELAVLNKPVPVKEDKTAAKAVTQRLRACRAGVLKCQYLPVV